MRGSSGSRRLPVRRVGYRLLVGLAVGSTLCVAPALASATSVPEVTWHEASVVSMTGATIEATINPEGSETSYEIRLECQSVERQGNCEPLTVGTQSTHGVLAAGFEAQTVDDIVTGLHPGYVYGYGVIATNSVGRAGFVHGGVITCPAEGFCATQPYMPGEALWVIEAAERAASEAPRLEAEREARQREAEERPAREAAERAAKEREIREAGERAGREAAERAAAVARSVKCVVPRLKGDSLGAARHALERAHCSLGRVSEPRRHHAPLVVTAQSVRSGRKLVKGAKVAVTLRTR